MLFATFVPVFLALALAVAGVAKVAELKGFRSTLEGLGLPPRLARAVGYTVPVMEIGSAVLLFLDPVRLYGAILLLLLLAGFAWSLWTARNRGEDLKCNCFGSVVPESFGWKTGVRISLMTLLDLYLLSSPGPIFVLDLPLAELLGAVVLSLGIMLMYALAAGLYDYTRSWKDASLE